MELIHGPPKDHIPATPGEVWSMKTIQRAVGSLLFLAAGLWCSAGPNMSASETTDAEAQFHLAEKLRYESHEHVKAIEAYQQVATRWPQSPWAPRALDMIGFIRYRDLREYEAAVKTYDELAAKYVGTPEADYGCFVAGCLLWRALGRPQEAVQRHCQFLTRSSARGTTVDPAIALAKDQVRRAVEQLCLDPDRSLPSKGTLAVTGRGRAAQFGVCLPGEAGYTLVYDLGGEAKTFNIQASGPCGKGILAVSVQDLFTPLRATEDGKPWASSAVIGDYMVLAGLGANKTYAVEGLKRRGRLTVRGSFDSGPFSLWFSDDPNTVVRVEYDLSGPKRSFSFSFDDVLTEKRGRLSLRLEVWEPLRVLREGQSVNTFRVEGLQHDVASPAAKKVRRTAEPSPPKKVTLIVEEIDPTKRYVIEPVGKE